ncbi:MAG: YwiC-like family protein [Vicinamibacterales bacterium]
MSLMDSGGIRRHALMLPLPKEHGAYAQMGIPLVTSLVVGGTTTASIAAAGALVLGFIAHEPLLVATGSRGGRARREAGRAAVAWLVATGGLAGAAAALAVTATPPSTRWTYLLPAVPAAVVFAAALRGVERRGGAEVLVALAFSLAAVPVCLAAGAAPSTAWGVALPFGVVFTAATLAVRAVTLRTRAHAAPAAAAMARAGAAAVAMTGLAGLAMASVWTPLPWASVVAAMPGAGAAVVLAARPPSARHLRRVGWTLSAVSTFAAAVLMAGA